MASAENEPHSRRPSKSDFKQQTLPAWQPILTPKTVICAFLSIGIIFVPIGILLLIASDSVVEVAIRYDKYQYGEETRDCHPVEVNGVMQPQLCSLQFEIPEKMENVYLYYELTNYYQNHRRYVKSRNDAQLRGDFPTKYNDLEDCLPRIANTSETQDVKDRPEFWFVPCGLIAWSQFNDTFQIFANGTREIKMNNSGIAWKSDREVKFRNPPDWNSVKGIHDPDVRFDDEEFIVWMRTAGLPHFRKLHRIIQGTLEPGMYTINITSNFPVRDFDGTKSFVLSTTSWVGGKNNFLGIAYIVIGSLCIVLGVVFLVVDHFKPRKLGDQQFLVATVRQ